VIFQPTTELADAIVNRVGLGSIAATVGITASVEAGLIEMIDTWGMTDTALLISMTGGVMFALKLRMDMKKAALDMKKSELEMELMKKKADKE
jgi:hypothetical protein